ncbi:DUF262 domain-containing protein [Mesorhizobium sp. M0040]|uniref:GmrSD restriction endonuclease domain-containing protein n=1 Tax=Mesorhizobium sp. M0040 TaxID=2956855 RepID=UPI00333AFD6E
MATNVVNLDALIPREDFFIEGGGDRPGSSGQERIDIHHLDNHFFATRLRKPDFQRETADWTPDKVVDLIRSFVDAELIPAIILWSAGNFSFVIDGAHRLSALLAWVLDDYGDNRKSLDYFGGRVSDDQRRIADRTRKLVKASVGSYGEYVGARNNPGALPPPMQIRYNNLANQYVTAQWVPTVDREVAEKSFFKINEAATPINPTEKKILRSRKSASAIAARAVTRAGTGHQYWSPFDPVKQTRIKELGKSIYQALYEPPIGEGPVRTLDLPVAGKGYNALPFVFDLINQVNKVTVPDGKRKSEPGLPEETDGVETIHYLEKTNKLIERITGDQSSSYGLHPVVYFYSRTGAFLPSAFFATSRFIDGIISSGTVREFLATRAKFEAFLLHHKEHVSLTVHKFGAGERSVPQLVLYLSSALLAFQTGKTGEEILAQFSENPNFQYLLPAKPPLLRRPSEESEKKTGFNKGTRSAAFINTAVAGAPKCGLCGAMVHKNSMHIDHKHRVREGGGNHFENAQITHPICDSLKS